MEEVRESMAIVKDAAAIELIWNLIRGKTDGISRVTFFPQKPDFPEASPCPQPLERASAESQGIESSRIREMLEALEQEKTLHLHGIMVLKNGKVIAETSFYPYRKEVWHAVYSMGKSVVSMAVGLLIQEGKLSLDTKIVDVLKRDASLISLLRRKNLTVEHLLTMTSGVAFNETGAVSGDDWVKSFLESAAHGEPGDAFEYNSMNTYMLSAVVTQVTGETLTDYLRPRLFEPLGIKDVFWESCPKGITKGGWGLFLRLEDMAKLGQLYLQGGEWQGRQILPAQWVEQSVTKKVTPGQETGFSGYGYQIWMGRREGSFAFNGMMGQNVFVYPDIQMVVATTAGNEEFFTSNAMQDILERYLPKPGEAGERREEDKREQQKLREAERRLSQPVKRRKKILAGGWHRKKTADDSWQRKAKKLDGKRYEIEAAYIGLFPLMGQVFHNNYTDGIREIGFECGEDRFFMTVMEGEEEKRLELGMDGAKEGTLNLHGEIYRVAAEGSFCTDEEGCSVLKIVISYLEDAFRRILKVCFEGERIELRATEVPGKAIILNGISSITGGLMEHPILKKIREHGKVDVVRLLMESAIEPAVEGKEKKENKEQKKAEQESEKDGADGHEEAAPQEGHKYEMQ